MISLQDAIERAKLMADDGGILKQNSYNLLINDIREEDRYPFTMSLVENGLMVRTGNIYRESQAVSDDVVSDVDITELRTILENSGLAVSKDGTVHFYGSSIPGLYKEKLPQTMPLNIAVVIFKQRADIAEKEKEKIDSLQDVLSDLYGKIKMRYETNRTPLISEIDSILNSLDEYKFSITSRSQTTNEIGNLIDQVYDGVMGRKWKNAMGSISNLQSILEEYEVEQMNNNSEFMNVYVTLETLNNMKNENPDSFEEIITGLGGVEAMKKRIMASLKKKSMIAKLDNVFAGGVRVYIGNGYIKNRIRSYIENEYDGENKGDQYYPSLVYYEFLDMIDVDDEGMVKNDMLFDDELNYAMDQMYINYESLKSHRLNPIKEVRFVDGEDLEIYEAYYYHDEADPSVGVHESFDPYDYEEKMEGSSVSKIKSAFDDMFDLVIEDAINNTDFEISSRESGKMKKVSDDDKFDEYQKKIKDEFGIDIYKFKNNLKGGEADGRNITDFDLDQLMMGIRVEMEHADDVMLALEIATDHLAEIDNYYDHLDEMEEEAISNGDDEL